MAAAAPPRVSRLSVTAIKGLGVVHPDVVDVTPTGVAGDRTFYLVDAEDALRSAFVPEPGWATPPRMTRRPAPSP